MTDNHDINDALKGNYLLVNLSISRWNASKPDKDLAIEAATAHGATPEAVRVTKKLMAGADAELNEVNKSLNAIRTYVYAVSLPWAGNDEGAKRGPRLIPTVKSLDILRQLRVYKNNFNQAMTDFKNVYTQRMSQALHNQGGLADPTQYPDVSELDDMFQVRMDIEPVPTVGDFSRMSLPAEVATALGKRMAGRQSKVIENAMADLTNRIVSAVSNMAAQLHKHANGEKTRLYGSLVDNVRGLLDLLKTSNLTNDPDLDELATMMDSIVTHDIKVLKNNPGTAKAVADKAAAIVQHITGPKTLKQEHAAFMKIASELPTTDEAVAAIEVGAVSQRPAAESALSSPTPASDATNYGDYLY